MLTIYSCIHETEPTSRKQQHKTDGMADGDSFIEYEQPHYLSNMPNRENHTSNTPYDKFSKRYSNTKQHTYIYMLNVKGMQHHFKHTNHKTYV